MADDQKKKITDLPVALSVSGSDIVVAVQNGVDTKQATIEQIGTNVNTSQAFSDLNTTSKNVVGAINEILQGMGAITLDGLSDVTITSALLANGQVLKYDATLQKWVNADPGGGSLSSLSDVTITALSLSNGQFLVYDSVSDKWVNKEVIHEPITQAQYDAMVEAGTVDPNVYYPISDGSLSAGEISYDNTSSGLEATDVQAAIDELNSAIPTKTSDLENDSGFAVIDDTVTANDKAWSSSKISNLPMPDTQMVTASGNNLNDYHTPSCFFAEQGLTNLPTSNDNFLILNYYAKWQSATRYTLAQLAVNATNCKTYIRIYSSSNNLWKSWLPLFYDATQLVSDLASNQDETDRIRQNIFSLYATNGENGFLKASGAVQANSGYFTTEYIRIYNGQSFKYNLAHGIVWPVICFFTGKDKSYIDTTKTVNGIDGYVSGTFTATDDGYVRFTYSKNVSFQNS